ncbi:962_t:CDS:2, partial [Ambispora leptoticha]
LDNHDDQIDLRRIIPFGDLPPDPSNSTVKKRNIIRAKNFFQQKVSEENYFSIYQTVLDNFYFSLIILDEETDSEIFMTLNTAGEDLTIPDLVKSALTRRNDNQAFQESNCYKRTLDDKINRFYRDKIKKGDKEENAKFLDLLVKYAEVYEKIINADNYRWWWEQNWSFEMFKTVFDLLLLLERKELISQVLAIHFQFQEKTQEEKLAITKELKKLVVYVFRAVIVKKGLEDADALRAIRINTLKMINSGQTSLFEQEKYPINLIIKEFQQGSNLFYQALGEQQNKRDKEFQS